MPISGVLLQCDPKRLSTAVEEVVARSRCEIRERRENALVVVTDTPTLDADRAEVEALSALEGVLAAHVVFSNIEDLT